jgi:hypothetical protein
LVLLLVLLAACGGAADPAGELAPTGTAAGTTASSPTPPATAVEQPLPTDPPPTTTGQQPATPDPIAAAVPQDPSTWPAPAAGTIHIDATQRFGPVSPWVYGSNFDPGMVVPVALLDAINADTGLRFMRFPGGSYGDLNTISPKQYDDFIELCRTLAAEPHIHVRYLNRTPADAAETVRYINVEKGYGVRYWAIGNEAPFFYLDETAEHYAAAWRDFAEAMLAVDPAIILVGPDFSQFGPAALAQTRSDVAEAREWTRIFLEANGDLLGLVTFHRYPYPQQMGVNPSIAGLRPIAAEFDATIPELRAMIRETTGRDIPIGLTEVNSDSNKSIAGEATPDSPFAAVWLADVIGRFIRHGEPVVAQYAFQMRDSRGGWGLLERTRVRPQYYVYQLYRHFGDELVYAATDEPDVMVVAARRSADGALTLMAVNLGDAAVERPLRLVGHPGGRAAVYRIDETNLTNLPAVPDGREAQPSLELADGAPLTLPPRSATLYVLP